ncbi:MAG: diguanylate cyclase domain-containing protein [Marinobacter adhaerens]
MTVSLGVAQVNSATESVEDAVNRADKALYVAKTGGRNPVCSAI